MKRVAVVVLVPFIWSLAAFAPPKAWMANAMISKQENIRM